MPLNRYFQIVHLKIKQLLMQEYLLMIHGTGYKDESPEVLKKHVEKYANWVQKMTDKGKYIKGDRLANSGNVLMDRDTVVIDGPFLESKEVVGGYILIRAENLEEATKYARECPLSEELPISIRPMYEWPEL